MKKNSTSESGLFNPRAFVAFTLCSAGALLAMVSFGADRADRPRPTNPTFGLRIFSGIAGVGFGPGPRGDPSNPRRSYTSRPGSLSSRTGWGRDSPAGGKTFQWGGA